MKRFCVGMYVCSSWKEEKRWKEWYGTLLEHSHTWKDDKDKQEEEGEKTVVLENRICSQFSRGKLPARVRLWQL